jgi:predicted RNA-binding protein with TRAM domain
MTSTTAEPVVAVRRGLSRRLVAAGVVGVLALLAFGGHWATTADGLGAGGGALRAPAPADKATYVDAALFGKWKYASVPTVMTTEGATVSGPPPLQLGDVTEVTITSVTPLVTENTAEADVAVLACARNSNRDWISGTQDIAVACASAVPIDGVTARFYPLPHGAGIIAKITPHHAGIVRITGYDVTFTQGIRSGHVRGGMDVTLTVR